MVKDKHLIHTFMSKGKLALGNFSCATGFREKHVLPLKLAYLTFSYRDELNAYLPLREWCSHPSTILA